MFRIERLLDIVIGDKLTITRFGLFLDKQAKNVFSVAPHLRRLFGPSKRVKMYTFIVTV